MSSAPADLLGFRSAVRARTGLAAAEVGIVGDGAHARTGGYHEGRDVLVSIGRYHPPATAHVGDAGEDYSARKLRDRTGLSLSSSAVDIGSAWRQGHGVWLRFNVLLVAALHGGDPALAAVRAVNFTVDGQTKHRTDREHGWAVEDSTDTVLTHTHVEFYRDTEGRRAQCLDRLLKLIDAAIAPPAATGGTDMDMSTKIVPATPDKPDRTFGEHTYDQQNLRNWLLGGGNLVPDAPAGAYPTADSPLGKLVAFLDAPAIPVTMSDADRADVAARVVGGLDYAALGAAVADALATRLAS